MNIAVIGTGFVGVVSAAVYASLNHRVIGLDIDHRKIEFLKKGVVPFFEPNLQELLITQQQAGKLSFTSDYQAAIPDADLVIVAVGTPSLQSGEVDLSYVKQACSSLAPYLKDEAIVALKSTVPPDIIWQLQPLMSSLAPHHFYLATLPEFLKEGSAVNDTLHPDRIVIGSSDQVVIEKLTTLHQPLNAPILVVKPQSAQMIKYASNAYLATRITFINQIANLCEHNQANIDEVIAGIGYDKRIGSHYWYPGLGYGGSCFPKDVNELASYAKRVGESDNLMITLATLNQARIPKLLTRIELMINGWRDQPVAVLGLAFKPHTNDTRESPASYIIPQILEKGAIVRSYDPKADWQPSTSINSDHYHQDATINDCLQNARVIMSLVEWPEFFAHQFEKVTRPVLFFDARNQFSSEVLNKLGYTYLGIGRP